MSIEETGRLVLGREFQQPDRRSCGAAVAVVAEALANPAYARRLLAGGDDVFGSEVLAMHRRITGPVDVSGALQAPWPRVVGTPPWALARQLGRRVDPPQLVVARVRPDVAWATMQSTLRQARPVPVYVGDRWTPRHVVLAIEHLEDGVRTYEPSSGRVVDVPRTEWMEPRLRLGGWRWPWFVLSARRPPARHSRA